MDNEILNVLSEESKEKRWDTIHSRTVTREELKKQYDDWMEKNEKIKKAINECQSVILDLGCGVGIDTLHLVEEGKEVIASDFSTIAIEKIKKNIPEAKTLQFNMKNKFPFENILFEVIISNKAIHYFNEQETRRLISELHRILKPNGVFIFVVNSTNDKNYGAGQGILLEENFYEVRETTKRFFDKESLKKFFDKEHWEFIYMKEESKENRIKIVQLNANEKTSKKVTWTCMVKKKGE